jgi:hypothetical protein
VSRETEVDAQVAVETREEEGRAYVWEEADRAFGLMKILIFINGGVRLGFGMSEAYFW